MDNFWMTSMEHLDHFLEEHFAAIVSCPLCGAKYEPLEARVIDGQGDAELIHIECTRCRGAVAALISATPVGVTSVGIVTDLSSHDLFRLRGEEGVTTDDVLSFHTFITQEKGKQLLQII